MNRRTLRSIACPGCGHPILKTHHCQARPRVAGDEAAAPARSPLLPMPANFRAMWHGAEARPVQLPLVDEDQADE